MSKPVKHYDKWRIRWVDAKGQRRSKTFTQYESAELALRKVQVEEEERRRGLRPPELQPRRFAEAARYWREHRAPRKRSYKDDLSILTQLEEHFGRLLLTDTADWVPAVDRYLVKKSGRNPKTLNNHLTLLISVLRLSRTLGWVERLPEIKKPTVERDDTFDYLRNRDEVSRFLAAAKQEGDMPFMLYATALYTGMRAGELAGLEWLDVDLPNRLINVRRSFGGPTKNGRSRAVPILDGLLPLLLDWRAKHVGRFVFANRDGGMLQPSGRIFQETLRRVLQRADFPMVERGGKLASYIRFHDLRHSFASLWMMGSGDIFKLQRILGHQSQAMTQRYAKLDPKAFKDDYGRLGAAIGFP